MSSYYYRCVLLHIIMGTYVFILLQVRTSGCYEWRKRLGGCGANLDHCPAETLSPFSKHLFESPTGHSIYPE